MNKLEELESFELDEFEHENNITGEVEGWQRFKIKDLNSANWAMRKLSILEKQKEEVEELYAQEIKRIQNWYESATKRIDNQGSFFKAILEEYLMEKRQEDKKYRIDTPYGTMSTRKSPDKISIRDLDKLIEWLIMNGKDDLIKVTETVLPSELKSKFKTVGKTLITEDGEIIEGVEIQTGEERISLKINTMGGVKNE